MLRTGLLAALALGMVVIAGGRADAQARGGIGSGWGGVELLLNPAVQRELKMDGPAVEKARGLAVEMREKQKGLNALLEGLEGEDRSRRIQELAAAHAEQGNRAIGAILDPGQFARFRQVDLQQRGASALAEPQVAQALRLSPEQLDKLKPLLNHSVVRLREAAALSRGDRRAAFEKTQAIRKETDEAALALLDAGQKKAWHEMIGEPFDPNPAGRAAR